MTKLINVFLFVWWTLNSCHSGADHKRNFKSIRDITKFRQLDTISTTLSVDSSEKNKCQLFSEVKDYKLKNRIYETLNLKPIDKDIDTISYRFFCYKGWGNFYGLESETVVLTISKYKTNYFVEINERKIDSLGYIKRKVFRRTHPIDPLQFKKLQETVQQNGFYDLYSFHYSPCKLLIDGTGYIFEFNDGTNYKYFDIKTMDKKDINLYRQVLVTAQGYTRTIERIDNNHQD